MERNKLLFQKALLEATVQLHDEQLLTAPTCPAPSPRYLKKMSRILHMRLYPHATFTRKKVVWIAAVLALLMLLSVVAYANRNAIKSFFAEEHEDHIWFREVAPENPLDAIETYYAPSYVPEGYVLNREYRDNSSLYLVWENEQKKRITYDQSILGGGTNGMSTENKIIEEREYKGYQMLVGYHKEFVSVLWTDGTYVFFLSFSTSLTEQEMQAVFESIASQQ